PLYDIPVLKGEGLGISIAPFSQFEASGSLLLFDFPIAQGSCKYISRNNCISLKGSVNFSDILVGSLHASLQSTSKFSGIVNGVIKTPTTLPWKFKYLQNKTIASIIAMVDNTSISCEMDFYGMSIAHKITFNGSDQFPYFSYAIGDNLQ